MKKQITFYDSSAETDCIEYLANLRKCFRIISAKITRIKAKNNWDWNKYKLEVTFK